MGTAAHNPDSTPSVNYDKASELWKYIMILAERAIKKQYELYKIGNESLSLSVPIKLYRIDGNKTMFVAWFSHCANFIYNPDNVSLWGIFRRNRTRINQAYAPDDVLMHAFAFYCAYEITGNQTYLTWAKALVERMYALASRYQLFAFKLWSNGTVEYSPEGGNIYDQLPACCYLRWFGEKLDNQSWISLADTIWNKLWSYASPLLPVCINATGHVTNSIGAGLYYAVPCCLAELMFDSLTLREWAQQLINYYAKVMELDPDGHRLMQQNCYYHGTPRSTRRIYRLPQLTNHIRFLCAWTHLTGNRTGLEQAEHLASWAMTHMNATYGYIERLNAVNLSVIRTRIDTGYLTKFISGLLWLYRLTGNSTYADEALRLLKMLAEVMVRPDGLPYISWDAETGTILDARTDYLLAPLNEWLYCFSTIPMNNAVCLTPANFQDKYILPHLGNVCITTRKIQVFYYVPEGVIAGRVMVPPGITSLKLNGTEWLFYNATSLVLPPGSWHVDITWGTLPTGQIRVKSISKAIPQSAVLNGTDFEIIVNATGLAILVVYPGDRGMPASVTIGGLVYILPTLTKEDFDKAADQCWYYDSTSNLIYIKVKGHSSVKIKISWLGGMSWLGLVWLGGITPMLPSRFTPVGQNQSMPMLAVAIVVAVTVVALLTRHGRKPVKANITYVSHDSRNGPVLRS